MSDYPMLISNKLHSFRNFGTTNIQHLKAFVKYLLHFQVFKRLFHDSRFNDLSANRNHSLI